MFHNEELANILQRYLVGLHGFGPVREFVTYFVGEVDSELIELVSLEIWNFEGNLIKEYELKSRLAVILSE